jgi:hypothetical protein
MSLTRPRHTISFTARKAFEWMSDARAVGAAARLGLAMKLLALRAAELSAGFDLAIALDVSTLHGEGPPPVALTPLANAIAMLRSNAVPPPLARRPVAITPT